MYKKDLRTGDRLIYRDGTERVLQLNTAMGDVLTNLDGEIKNTFSSFDSRFKSNVDSNHDVVSIRRPTVPSKYLKELDSTFIEIWSA